MRPVVVVVILGLLGVLSVLVGVAAGEFRYSPLIAALFVLSAAHGYVTQVRRRSDPVPEPELRYSRVAFAVLTGLMVCLTALWTFGAWDYARARVWVAALVCAAAAAFCGSFLVLAAVGKVRCGRIWFTAHGIHQRGRAFSSFLPWESVAGVKPAWNGKPEVLIVAYANAPWERQQHARVWKLDQLPPVPMIEIDCTVLTCTPDHALRVVTAYVDDPDKRGELR
ncbi:hypothetical protein [Amycolatopsis magusensis]|uniref:hypothetical protein n=1 Tax=Amycolatopsis magusensis TaxID=882444 RepID=UPI003794F2E4